MTIAEKKYCLRFWLKEFGLTSDESKKALEELFYLTAIIPANQKWLDVFPASESSGQLLENLVYMVEKTQEKFVMRSPGQERSTVCEPEYMKNSKDKLLKNLQSVGVINEINPKNYTPDLICIFGSTKYTMQKKIDYVSLLMGKRMSSKYIILLTGERYLSENVDGTKQELELLAKKIGLKDYLLLTETHLFEEMYQNSVLPSYKIALEIIDTPRRNLPRPNSETSLIELTEWLKNKKDIKKILFVSNQPYIAYQSDIVNTVFKKTSCEYDFEIVGPSIGGYENIKRSIDGFGSYIWGALPNILSKLDLNHVNDNIKERLRRTYRSESLIYQDLPKIFKT